MSEYWASDDEADAIAKQHADEERGQFPLLDPRGVTSHEPREVAERRRWDAGQVLAGHLLANGLTEEGEAFKYCHSRKTYSECDGCRRVMAFWNRCDIFFCPQCSPRLSKIRLDGLMFFVEKMARTKHIVLTMKNVPTLSAAYLSEARARLARFRRRKIFRGTTCGLWAMEITNEGNGWHVHFHLVVDAPWIPVRELSAEWEAVCGDGSKVVWIEDATRGGLKANLPRYVAKYASKGFRPQDWSAEQFCEFVQAVKGGRTFGVFGKLCGARAEWREWLKVALANRKKCECGCCTKRYFSEQEFEWLKLQREASHERVCRPQPPEHPQFAFAWN